jgi:hypothetical protein
VLIWNGCANNKAIKITIFDLFVASMKLSAVSALAHKLLYMQILEPDGLDFTMYG